MVSMAATRVALSEGGGRETIAKQQHGGARVPVLLKKPVVKPNSTQHTYFPLKR
jgi:hypothetical protein